MVINYLYINKNLKKVYFLENSVKQIVKTKEKI